MLLTSTTPGEAIDIKAITEPGGDISDESLVQQVMQGDINAYGLIMRRYNRRMYRVARSMIKNDADALDIVQEAHIKAYTKLNEYRGDSQFSTWLAVITRNEALMRLRKTRWEVSMPQNETEFLDHFNSTQKSDSTRHDPESIFENKQLRGLINENVDRLPDDFREVFVLRTVEQFSVQETADILDIKPETVKTRLFRAKRLLRNQIQAAFDQAGTQVYEVGGAHCDTIVFNVLARLHHHAKYNRVFSID